MLHKDKTPPVRITIRSFTDFHKQSGTQMCQSFSCQINFSNLQTNQTRFNYENFI